MPFAGKYHPPMFSLARPCLATILSTLVLAGMSPWHSVVGQESQAPKPKRALEHEDYDLWKQISGETLSRDGSIAMYSLVSAEDDPQVIVRRLDNGQEYTIERARNARLSFDGTAVFYLVPPEKKELEAARKAKKKPDEMPKSRFEMLDLSTGETTAIERVRSYQIPDKGDGWVAILLEKPLNNSAAKETAKPNKTRPPHPQPKPSEGQETGKPSEKPQSKSGEEKQEEPEEGGKPDAKKKEKKKDPGTVLVLRQLGTGMELRFPNVVSYRFSETGNKLAWAASAEKPEHDGVFVISFPNLTPQQIIQGRGNYISLSFDEKGKQLAFLTDRDDYEAKQSQRALYLWLQGKKSAEKHVDSSTPGIPEGWEVVGGGLSFSEDGKRILLSTRPRKPDEAEDEDGGEGEEKEDEKPEVKLDIWHWQDPYIQPMQLRRAGFEANRSYDAMYEISGQRFQQLGSLDVPQVSIGNEGKANIAVGSSDLPYRIMSSWDSPGYQDVYLIDLNSGEQERVLERVQSSASLSPAAKYLTWWDTTNLQWMVMSVQDRKPRVLSDQLPHPVHNELDDTPAPPRAYGMAGWLDNDRSVVIYDAYDLWLVDPAGKRAPRCITEGYGREHHIRFRYTRLDREARFIAADESLLLSAFHETKKSSGYFADQINGNEPPTSLVMLDEAIRVQTKAEDADTLLVSRSTFREFPDLWRTNAKFQDLARISNANPQQSQFHWGTAELVEWASLDGEQLQGILYKPDGFDPKKQYPMLVYFYERNSDSLHRYVSPAPARASINYSFYVSRGYLVFVPDITYRTGHPGQSCVNAVMPGVTSLINKGFVKRDGIGVQGHSWGGYQIAYLVTRCNLFTAAEAGAPVSNMTSAYGGIRWSSGMSRMFQYERTQSRIGGTLWDAQQKYIENSPIFQVDQIETPLLILHNDQDGAVPWYQGIELFVAMRRLGKPCWLFNYNGEDHGLAKDQNKRDWSVRLQQYFDHYCKGAPAPKWLAEGVPATEKGKTLGLELIEEGAASENKEHQ